MLQKSAKRTLKTIKFGITVNGLLKELATTLKNSISPLLLLKMITRTITLGLTGFFNIGTAFSNYRNRQWVVETQGLWDTELEYIKELLDSDLRNNSAWNERFFVISRNGKQKLTKEVIEKEVKFALEYIKKAPNNQSPWAYLKGFVNSKVLETDFF